MRLNKVTLGTDPEMFLFNTETAKFVSAVGLIPGTKENPTPIRNKSLKQPGFALQTDNVLVEFNVPPVDLNNKKQFIANIIKMQYFVQQYVKAINPCLDIKCQASAEFPLSELQTKQSQLFGCDPDFNAYTLQENCAPKLTNPQLRSAGFHIHVGYSHPNLETNINIIKYLDAYVGLPSVLFDTDKYRRQLYGKAGSFRFQQHGVEWRTLSSFFLQNRRTLSCIYDLIKIALDALEYEIPLPDAQQVCYAINNSDTKLAGELIKKLEIKSLK